MPQNQNISEHGREPADFTPEEQSHLLTSESFLCRVARIPQLEAL
jgi:hypothetical protein